VKSRGVLALLSALTVPLAVLGCGPDEPVVDRAPPFELRTIDGFDSERWTGKQAGNDPPVAMVGKTPITQSMLARQLERSGPDVSPRQALNRMIEFELLARKAYEAGHYNDAVVGESMRGALTRTWIEDAFDINLKPSDMDPDFKQKVYDRMKGMFDHYERFFIADAQILCCDRGNPEACYSNLFDDVADRVQHYESCFDFHREDAEKLRAALANAKTLPELKEAFSVASMDYPQPALRTQFGTKSLLATYEFQYDVDRTYDQQFGDGVKIMYRAFAQPVMDGARDAWFSTGRTTPALSTVRKSEFGYHILFIYKVEPERHSALDDPEVQKTIEDNTYEIWRKRYFGEQMEALCEKAGCDLHHQRLVPLQELQSQK
jgi:hypothetical protein